MLHAVSLSCVAVVPVQRLYSHDPSLGAAGGGGQCAPGACGGGSAPWGRGTMVSLGQQLLVQAAPGLCATALGASVSVFVCVTYSGRAPL
jgi:hypothetical protein